MLFQSQIIQLGKKNSEEGGRWDGWTERWDVRRRREESIQQCNFTAENVLFSFSAFFFTPSLKHLFICNIPPKGTEFNIRLFSHCLGCELFFFF